MKVLDDHTPKEMNWVDYCDSLSNEQFWLRARLQKSWRASEYIDGPATVERRAEIDVGVAGRTT